MIMVEPIVSIVMLSWNRKEDVRESLTRIAKIEYNNYEVIVVDNASTDGTQDMVRTEFPYVKLIEMHENVGIKAYNVGFVQAKGDYIIIIDDDSFPATSAIRRMVRAFEQDPQLGVCAFDVRNYYNYDDINAEIDDDEGVKAVPRDYYMGFNGAGVAIRRDLFKQIGYYPEEFFLYFNEMDCAYKIWDAGYKIEFFSNIVSYHKYSPANRASWRAPFFYTRNAFWLIWKHFPIGLAIKATIKLINNCFYYSLEQKTNVYIKAMWDAFKNSGKLKGKRKPVRKEVVEKLRNPLNIAFTFYR